MSGNQEPILVKEVSVKGIPSPLLKLKSWQWWVLVSINIFFLIGGQAASVLLGRFYYDEGGNSKWMATLVQTAAFPILYIPLLLLPSSSSSGPASCTLKTIVLIYVLLGVIIAGDNMLYSVGLLYLSASTYSLICATQLAFNAVFSYFINAQKFTALILNSVVLLSFSAALIALNDDADTPSGVSRSKYIVGFVCTLAASALYSLLLSLMQFSFEKILKKETFSVVLEMQIYTCLVATCVAVIGLFASGEWRTLHGEMEGYHKGQTSYVLTLVGTAVTWQVCSVGVVGLIFLVTSLFSNVISTLSLAVTPLAALAVFRDKMSGVKVMAMLIALWGFVSYVYQNHLDDLKVRRAIYTLGIRGTGQALDRVGSLLQGSHRLEEHRDVNNISVGSGTNIQDNSLVHVAKTNIGGKDLPTIIGDNVTVGHSAVIHGCTVEDESFVGMGATLLDGVVVEKHAMVAAGSLVRQNTRIPSGEVWGGNPAKFMRKLTDEEIAYISKSAENYINLAHIHAAENSKSFDEIEEEVRTQG